MIRPGSGERTLRLAGAITGDFCLAWATLAAAIYLRRSVPIPFTRSLLPAAKLPLDAPIVLLFGGAFVAALGGLWVAFARWRSRSGVAVTDADRALVDQALRLRP